MFYLAFHGAPGSLRSVIETIKSDAICRAFKNFGNCGHRVLIYFGACSVLRGGEGQKFAADFLRVSKCHALIGYTAEINWMESLVTDLLFLKRFYGHRDPWMHIESIFNSVLRDFPAAQKLGYTLKKC